MGYVIAFAIFAVILVVPIKIGAHVVEARNTSFGYALVTVVILAAISTTIKVSVTNLFASFVLTVSIGALVIAAILGTTFLRGLAVSVIAAAIQIGVMLVLAGVVGVVL